MNLLACLTCLAAGLLIGFLLGRGSKDDFYLTLLHKQQKRGDYWFDKYQKQIKPDWECLSDEAKEELE